MNDEEVVITSQEEEQSQAPQRSRKTVSERLDDVQKGMNDVGKTIETIGKGEERFLKLCLVLSSYMVSMSKNISIEEAIKEVEENYNNKKGLSKLKEFIKYQGGNISDIPVEEDND